MSGRRITASTTWRFQPGTASNPLPDGGSEDWTVSLAERVVSSVRMTIRIDSPLGGRIGE